MKLGLSDKGRKPKVQCIAISFFVLLVVVVFFGGGGMQSETMILVHV